MKRVMLEQGSPEWLAWRLTKLTATDASVIMECNPWTTPYKLWEQKLGIAGPQEQNEFMRIGSEREPLALAEFNKLSKVTYKPAVYESEIYPFMGASLDGVFIVEGIVSCACEIKCCQQKTHSQLMEGNIPDYMIAQMQWQMNILELPYMALFAYSPTSNKIIMIDRDQEYIYKMINKAKEFWDCVQSRTPPLLTDKDYKAMDGLEWGMTASTWKDAKAMLAHWEAKEAELRKELIKQAGSSNAKGCGIKLTKVIRSGNIDYPKLVAEMGFEQEAEKYRKDSSTSFRITNE